MKEYTDIFPARWSEESERYRVSAMHSQDFHGILPNEVVAEGVSHRSIREWIRNHPEGDYLVQLVGERHHGPVANPPVTAIVMFNDEAMRHQFTEDFNLG